VVPNVPEHGKFVVTPDLPSGFSLDHGTGVISGVRDKQVDYQDYFVSCENVAGKAQAKFGFAVQSPAPDHLEYTVPNLLRPGATVSFKPEDAHTDNLKFSVHPDLPDSLQLDAKTGLIDGKLGKGEHDEAEYTIRAENRGGSASTVIGFVVKHPNISYQHVPDSIKRGKKYILRPRAEFFKPNKFTADSPLPHGLKLDESTGDITGEANISNNTGFDHHVKITASETGADATATATIHFQVQQLEQPIPAWVYVAIASAVVILLLLIIFCCCCQKKEEASYKPLDKNPEPEPPKDVGPFQLKLTWETAEGNVVVKTATKKPLGLKFPTALPIKIHQEAHAHGEELGIQIGWTLLELEEMQGDQSSRKFDMRTYATFHDADMQLHKSVAKLEEGTFAAKVALTWITPNGNETTVVATKKPLGLKYPASLPIIIESEAHGHGEELGIQVGWTLKAIDNMIVTNMTDYATVNKALHDAVLKLPRVGASGTSQKNR
jgi:hypothetical protein